MEDVKKWVGTNLLRLKKPRQSATSNITTYTKGPWHREWYDYLYRKWLIDSRQRVVVDGEASKWKSVLCGVPQGSVLGSILFLIYINDLIDDITSSAQVCLRYYRV